jgi:hypothetical protein
MSNLFRKISAIALTVAFAIGTTVLLPADGFARGGGHVRFNGGGHHSASFHGHYSGAHYHGHNHHYNHHYNHHGNHNNYHHHYEYDHWHNHYNYYGRWAGAAIGAVALGTVVYSLPSSCVKVRRGDVVYKQCGSTWYAPRYQGSNLVYVSVRAP